MNRINRRGFMRQTAGAAAAVALGKSAIGQESTAKLTGTTIRALGKTGISCSLLGMGTGMKAGGKQSALTRKGRDAFLSLVAHAYERGVRYFDMADSYGAHPYLKESMKNGPVERDKVMLLTKTGAKDPVLIRADLERFRKELDTDYVDVVLMHCMTDPAWPEKLRPCMDAMEEAKQKGIIRAHGVSCHSLGALKSAADSDWVDILLARINPFGVKMDAPAEQVVPVIRKAHEAGKGILGMKIAGEGQIVDKLAQSIAFALKLGTVDAMPIGFLEPTEVDQAFAHIEAA